MANLLLSVMGLSLSFECELIRERQREGMELSGKAGVYTGRRRALISDQTTELVSRLTAEEGKSALAREFGVDRRSIHRYKARGALIGCPAKLSWKY